MNNNLTLYTNPQSRGLIVQWLLAEAQLPHTVHIVEFGGEFQAKDYKSINPMQKVPTLIHGNKTITEVAAICTYVAEVFPEAQLKPQTIEALADYFRWLFFAAGPLETAITNKNLGVEVSANQQGFVGYGSFERTVSTLKEYLRQKTYIAGEEFSAADVYVGSQTYWGLRFGTLPDAPELVQYVEKLKTRTAFIQTFGNETGD